MEANGRTHEPNLREVVSQLDDLKELQKEKLDGLIKIIDERHVFYKERAAEQQKAVEVALTALKEQTAASFAASEKAIEKSEESQKVYNQGHNDLTRKMETQYATMMPREESRLKWDSVDKEIMSLRETRSEGSGKEIALYRRGELDKWVIGLITAIVGGLIGHFWGR